MHQAKHPLLKAHEIATYIRQQVITEDLEFIMYGHDANEDISDGLDLIDCSEIPSESEPESSTHTSIGITGYKLEQAVEDCLNQNPVMGYIITHIGQFTDLDIKQMRNGNYDWNTI
ncbi:hypothetical protein AB6E94_19065 [Vibrio lentus]|uniref:hypothetical protein n=1 Tax=Vibrio splendidus TaxID=29497 RepID=UPI000C835223|nr:hypothetical protein [Vibrio splendidus]PMG17802.1 hypothetical protein BCU98_00285 [Vibrio splendidus]